MTNEEFLVTLNSYYETYGDGMHQEIGQNLQRAQQQWVVFCAIWDAGQPSDLNLVSCLKSAANLLEAHVEALNNVVAFLFTESQEKTAEALELNRFVRYEIQPRENTMRIAASRIIENQIDGTAAAASEDMRRILRNQSEELAQINRTIYNIGQASQVTGYVLNAAFVIAMLV
jgi:hypothetical protein